MTMQPGDLSNAFHVYWEEMKRCRTAKTYWALLHVTVCLPDICAALQSRKGNASGALYQRWCNQYLPGPGLTGAEWRGMRNRVLHEGRTLTDSRAKPRFKGFSFGQPASDGQVDHMRVESGILFLDVHMLSFEMTEGVWRWIRYIEQNPKTLEAINTASNLPSLVTVTESLSVTIVAAGQPAMIVRTSVTSSF
jgi:hypothetical protein